MKLPELKVYETQKDYAREEANEPYNSNQYELDKVLRHNEQIAAQLTSAIKLSNSSSSSRYEKDIEDTYKRFLDKLNKGEL